MISLCVLNWNSLNTLKKIIDIFLKLEIDKQIIVFDQNSNDGSAEYLNNLSDLDVKKILSEKNVGISTARNRMIKESVYDYVLLLDSDIVPILNSVESMYYFMLNNPDFAYLGYNYKQYVKNDSLATPYEKGIFQSDVCLLYSKNKDELCLSESKPKQYEIALTQYGIFRKNCLLDCPFPEFKPFNEEGWGCEDNMVGLAICQNDIGKGGMIKNRFYYHEKNSSKKSLGENFYLKYLERCVCYKYFEKFLSGSQKLESLKSNSLPKTRLDISSGECTDEIKKMFYFFEFDENSANNFHLTRLVDFLSSTTANHEIERELTRVFDRLNKFVRV